MVINRFSIYLSRKKKWNLTSVINKKQSFLALLTTLLLKTNEENLSDGLFSRFNETVVCLANLKHCGSFELFETLSSGMAYMCIEQREGIV